MYAYEQINKALQKQNTDLKEKGYYVHAVKDLYKQNPSISNWVNVHTHGLEKYGLTNISIVAPKDDKRLADIIHTVATMMVEGEYFEPNPAIVHYIDRPDGTCRFKFKIFPTECFGEDSWRLVLTDPDTNKFWYEDDSDSIYALQITPLFHQYE